MDGSQNWLSLLEYSAKYRVSISTLRRRIKSGEVEFQFADGRYLLLDGPSSGTEVIAPPIQKPQIQRPLSALPGTKLKMVPPVEPTLPPVETERGSVDKLLAEVKRAYMQILQEKEEQILLLRSEVSDLKTLVGVLEEQNGQLKKPMSAKRESEDDFELDLEI